jgi:hypothetical protein
LGKVAVEVCMQMRGSFRAHLEWTSPPVVVSASFIVVVAFDDGIVCAANSSSIGGTAA